MDFDKLMRKHRRDKTSRKRKRKSSSSNSSASAPSSTNTITTTEDTRQPSNKISRQSTNNEKVLEYSSQYSDRNFEVHQSKLTKVDREWTKPYQFTEDWHTRHTAYWSHHLKSMVGLPINYLEVGCYEGLSTCWMLDNVLKHHSESKYTVCDTFCGVQQLEDVAETTHVTSLTRQRFDHNIGSVQGVSHLKLTLYPEFSCNMYYKLFSNVEKKKDEKGNENELYDIIYIDGSHVARDVLLDAVCSFTLLKVNGILMFDDYQWKLLKNEYNCPGLGIDVFKSCFEHLFEPIHIGYQYHLKKRMNGPLGHVGSTPVSDNRSKSNSNSNSSSRIQGAIKAEEAEKVLPIPEWWVQFVSKILPSVVSTTSASTTTTALQKHIMVLGDVEQSKIEYFSEQISGGDSTRTISSSSDESHHITYISTNLTLKQKLNMNASPNNYTLYIGHSHVILSKELIKSSYTPIYDIIIIGNIGGDASVSINKNIN